MPSVIVRYRGAVRQKIDITRDPITVGRADTCAIILRDDAEVSREHAQLWLDDDGRVIVADCNSKNGTRVDGGQPLRNAKRLAHRGVQIGEHELELVDALPAPGPSAVEFEPDAPTLTGNTRVFPSSKRLDLTEQRLTLLMSLAERIGGAFERKQLLEQGIDACCEALGFDRALIAMKTARGDTEPPITRNVQRDETGAFKISRSLVNRALLRGERTIVNNPATDLMNLSESLVRFPICSALCVPIMFRDEILGVIYGDRTTAAQEFTAADVDFFAAIARQLGNGIANLRMFQQHARSQQIIRELQQARLIQRKLLPDGPLRCPGLVLHGYNEPSSEVGGDYFDYFEIGDGRVGFIIADVTGHGLPAAMIMSNMQAAVRVGMTREIPLDVLARRLNRLAHTNTDSDVFITAILGTVEQHTGRVDYVSAGHPGPVLLGPGGTVVADNERNSLAFGIVPDENYELHTVPAAGFRSLLFFTDGLIEAADAAGALLETPPIADRLTRLATHDPDALIAAALDCVRAHTGGVPLTDDLTLLAIHRCDA